MGYFSNLTIDHDDYSEDNSYPSPDKQLMWRLEDLQRHLKRLKETGAPHRGKDMGLRLSENDIRYTIPECFEYIADAESAIGLTSSDLHSKYGIDAPEDTKFIHHISSIGPPSFCQFELVGTYNTSPNVA